MPTGPSRTADKFIVRLPEGLRSRILTKAYNRHESMNTLIIKALERYLDQEDKFEVLLDTLAKQAEANQSPIKKSA
ncbi:MULTISPECIES: Arc family DNA-binding protein [Pseudomonas]|uniref:Arc family DNA-binding protein n=1 Tax=Pseudomonas TaxID=286 RepID=UPI002595B441|nr:MULTISPECIES: Arc family DNA-binding protein [Pseudomonas]